MFETCDQRVFTHGQEIRDTHNEGGLDHGHHDTLLLHLLGERLCPGLQTSLGARVCGEERRGDPTGEGSDIEDERLGLASTGRSRDKGGENRTGDLECAEGVLRVSCGTVSRAQYARPGR